MCGWRTVVGAERCCSPVLIILFSLGLAWSWGSLSDLGASAWILQALARMGNVEWEMQNADFWQRIPVDGSSSC
jgi:hypothetical protein